jgi:outer membrane protein OmpA-like peptidoglycan-associated protein
MRDLQSRFHRLAVLLTTAVVAGCASSVPSDKIDHLEGKVTEQESRLTRLQQSVSASETKQRYLSDQVEMLSAGGGSGEVRETGEAKVLFDFNSYDLTAEAKKSLDELAASLDDDPRAIVEIRGYTDAVGSKTYNYQLGEMRAESVARYLQKQHRIPLYRLNRISYGEDSPASVSSEDQRVAANRRVEVRVMSSGGSGGAELP